MYAFCAVSWKDKILDYEIETGLRVFMRRVSLLPWKDKILDYEIETRPHQSPTQAHRLQTWKDKILDYEIETSGLWTLRIYRAIAWKDKILDYEIETLSLGGGDGSTAMFLKR